VSPLFDFENITSFADDNFVVVGNKVIKNLIADLEKELEKIARWLKDSGFHIIRSKTDICLLNAMSSLKPQLM
jgi:hypothetical protein